MTLLWWSHDSFGTMHKTKEINCNCNALVHVPAQYNFYCNLLALEEKAFIFADINECLSNGGRGPCAQICTNTIGSFQCSCQPGYTAAGYACNGEDKYGSYPTGW